MIHIDNYGNFIYNTFIVGGGDYMVGTSIELRVGLSNRYNGFYSNVTRHILRINS